MHRITRIGHTVICLSLAALLPLAGCTRQRETLPSTVEVQLPDGTVVSVEEGAGAASLADSVWEFRTPGGDPFLTVVFGPAGELARFENNTIGSEILGGTLIFDGDVHDTGIAPIQYSATTYGAETASGTGFAFDAVLSAMVPVLGEIGSGELSSSGSLSDTDPDVMTGTFDYTFSVNNDLPIPLPFSIDTIEGTIEYTAYRVQ